MMFKFQYIFLTDDIHLVGYCLLPFIMPSSARKLPDDNDDGNDEDLENIGGKRKKSNTSKPRKKLAAVKATDLSALASLIMFRSVGFCLVFF